MNLQYILSFLVDDPNFLLKIDIINNNEYEYDNAVTVTDIDTNTDTNTDTDTHTNSRVKNNNGHIKINMASIVKKIRPLFIYEKESCSDLPNFAKKFIPTYFYRLGIKNIMDKGINKINISFLNSLNVLFRNEIFGMNPDLQDKNYVDIESFVSTLISRNYHIDKIKNVNNNKLINHDHIKNITEGIITHSLIQRIVNIFEINLVIFDFDKSEIYLYWCHGIKFPFFNFFKKLYMMSFISGNYEPITSLDKQLSDGEKITYYLEFLTNKNNIKFYDQPTLNIYSLLYINKLDIDMQTKLLIYDLYYKKKSTDK
jgi:hypothetical protein